MSEEPKGQQGPQKEQRQDQGELPKKVLKTSSSSSSLSFLKRTSFYPKIKKKVTPLDKVKAEVKNTDKEKQDKELDR